MVARLRSPGLGAPDSLWVCPRSQDRRHYCPLCPMPESTPLSVKPHDANDERPALGTRGPIVVATPVLQVVVALDQSPEDPVTTAAPGDTTRIEVHGTGEHGCDALTMSVVFGLPQRGPGRLTRLQGDGPKGLSILRILDGHPHGLTCLVHQRQSRIPED